MKKLLLIVALTLLFTGCSSQNNPPNTSSNSSPTSIKKNNSTNINALPENLIACDPIYFERGEDGIAPDCNTFSGGPVCSYHTKEKNGETKKETIQYTNPCAACRFYGKTGVRKIGSSIFTHHGYIEGGCEGIIWE